MSVIITVTADQYTCPEDCGSRLSDLLEQLLADGGLRGGELSVIITDDHCLQELNLRYRGRDIPTDVLSFNYLDDERPPSPDFFPVGDIYISLDRAREQASSAGLVLEQELTRLAVHGALHLLGYDHEKPAAARLMRKKETELMHRFNCPG